MRKLLKKINNLPIDLRTIFDRIYEIKIYNDKIEIPEKLKEHFIGAEEQEIVVITNKILNQETAFNPLRSRRPQPADSLETTDELKKNCPFCIPKDTIPKDEIGRIENESAISGSNIADSLKYHSLIVFKKHNFLDLKKNDIIDALELSNLWWDKIFEYDKNLNPNTNIIFNNNNTSYIGKESGVKISYYADKFSIGIKFGFLIWNNGYKAAASISHPHLQIFAKESLPEKLEFIKTRILDYKKQFDSDYYNDLFLIHKNLELATETNELKIIISLTPFKDNEIIIYAQNKWDAETLCEIIENYKKFSGSFNLFLLKETYDNLPIGFIVDRGDPKKENSDIGSLEIYAFSVVESDIEKFSKNFLECFN